MASPSASPYQPASRRPIAGAFRATGTWAVRVCLRWRVHPDAISCLSVVAAALGAWALLEARAHPRLLLAAPLFLYARLWMNMLDGMVALASGRASPRGEILNEIPDRLSDLLVFSGLAHSGLCNPFLGYWAGIAALFTAYVGTFGQAVAGRREYGGLMPKPWRMVMVHLGAWGAYADLGRRGGAPGAGGLSVLDWTCLLVLAGCLQTIWVRLARTFRRLAGDRG